MKKLIKNVFAVVLTAMLVSACTKSNTTGKTRTITDHTGAQVEIPTEINRVVIGSILPLPSVFCLFRGGASEIVGMAPSSMAAAKNSQLAKVFPEILNADTSFIKNDAINAEELLKLKPDIAFYLAGNDSEKEIFEKAGIPAIGFSTTLADYNCVGTYESWIKLLGEIYGDEEKSNKIIKRGREIEAMVTERLSKLTESEKPNVMVLFQYSKGNIVTAGYNFFTKYWIETAGGKNVAAEIKGSKSINIEQVYEWNPEMIFITNFSPYLPEDLYNNDTNGQDWSVVKAVQDRKVYKFPLGMYRWFPPASDTPLVLLWLAKNIQPKYFEDIDINAEVKKYYKEFYNVDLSDKDLHDIFNPSPEAAGVSK